MTSTEMDLDRKESRKNLYEEVKGCVWVLRIKGTWKGERRVIIRTAFAVQKDGILMTCARHWCRWHDVIIKARPLGSLMGFKNRAKILERKIEFDMCVLQLNVEVRQWAGYGSGDLKVGESVLIIGHPLELIGSGVTGQVCFECTNKPQAFLSCLEKEEYTPCDISDCHSLEVTPLYRTLGDVWYSKKFWMKSKKYFVRRLAAELPVIQCSGLVGEKGFAGSPMFNGRGEIIGMYVTKSNGFQFGIHVTAMRLYQIHVFERKSLKHLTALSAMSSTEMDLVEQEVKQSLYESIKGCVWVLEIKGTWKGDERMIIHTAFAIRKNGILMTCSRHWSRWHDVKIMARPLGNGMGFKYNAEILRNLNVFDTCMLKLDVEVRQWARYASGDLRVGDSVLIIGHPSRFTGSGVTGIINYECTESPQAFLSLKFTTCINHNDHSSTVTPLYRTMGNVWDSVKVKERINNSFVSRLVAELPIVQCSSLIGGKGFAGSPMFNVKGEVVGMYVTKSSGFQIGIHVSALKLFQKQYLPDHVNEDGER